jgi:hypothetical protein
MLKFLAIFFLFIGEICDSYARRMVKRTEKRGNAKGRGGDKGKGNM